MDAFAELTRVIDCLLGPGGCPWDQEQTMHSMRGDLLEEACEVIEAIDLGDNEHIKEELGDLFFNAVFMCKLAAKENRCDLSSVLKELTDKLIRRHPHVFGETGKGKEKEIKDTQAVLEQWDKIKKTEKGKETRATIFDGIPKGLPALARARKMLKKMKKTGETMPALSVVQPKLDSEVAVGEYLLQIVAEANEHGVDAEQALRATLAHIEHNHI